MKAQMSTHSLSGASAPALISAEGLEVHFARRGSNAVKAVDGVSFAVERGTTFSVIGESGSGKSTLGRALVCLTRPTLGKLLHRGVDPFAMRAGELRRHRRSFQIIFQDPHASLNPRLSIGASVREPLDIVGEVAADRRDGLVVEMLERVGLNPEVAYRYPHELSGGQKQRANIARALVVRPELIVCDEVVAALDASIKAEVLNLFVDLQAQYGLTYVFISHDLSVVSYLSDQIAVMYLGRLVELATTDAIVTQALHPYTQALIASQPLVTSTSPAASRRRALHGDVPNPINPPSGCRFRTRCPLATPLCAERTPQWREASIGHFVACHYAAGPGGISHPSAGMAELVDPS